LNKTRVRQQVECANTVNKMPHGGGKKNKWAGNGKRTRRKNGAFSRARGSTQERVVSANRL